MSTAARVPETWELTGDDARETLASTGSDRPDEDAVVRLRAADGTSHSRGLAFAVSLVLVQGLVIVVGFAVATRLGGLPLSCCSTRSSASAPGPTSDLLDECRRAGDARRPTASVSAADDRARRDTLITATVAMGQLERAMNRIYGIEKDRPFAEKYSRAFVLAVSAGLVIAVAFALLAFGRGLVDEAHAAVGLARRPLAARDRSRRHRARRALPLVRRRGGSPAGPWLAFGASVSVVGWTLDHRRARAGLRPTSRRSGRRTARSPGSLRSSCGRSSRRSRSSTASRSPPSSRPFEPAPRSRRIAAGRAAVTRPASA